MTRGEWRTALPLLRRDYDLNQEHCGDDHPDTFLSANNLANSLRALGEYEQARALDQDTLTRYRRIRGDDHPHTLASAVHLANNLSALGEDAAAEQWRTWAERQAADRSPNAN